MESGNNHYHSVDGVLFSESQLIRYPQGKQDGTYTIPNGTESVAFESFGFCGVGHVSIEGAFEDVHSLQRLIVPENLHSISDSAFRGVSQSISILFLGKRPSYFMSGGYWQSGPNLTIQYTTPDSLFEPNEPRYYESRYPTSLYEGPLDTRFYQHRITRIQMTDGGDLNIEWLANKATVYAVDASEDLAEWETVASDLPGAAGRTQFTIPTTGNQSTLSGARYFRVRSIQP